MRKNDSQVVNLFTLLGSTIVKALRYLLMKLTPVSDPIKLFSSLTKNFPFFAG